MASMIQSIDLKQDKPKRERCSFDTCKKKLLITDFKCLCKSRFCIRHRFPEEHDCTFDFKQRGRDIQNKQLTSKKSNINVHTQDYGGNAY